MVYVKASLGVGFAGSQLGEEPRDQRRHRRVPLGGSYARPAIGLVVHSNSDIFHIITLSQEASGVETFFLPPNWAKASTMSLGDGCPWSQA